MDIESMEGCCFLEKVKITSTANNCMHNPRFSGAKRTNF